MQQFTYFAQTPGYNCEGSADSSYGAGSFGTCGTSSTSTNSGGTTTTTQTDTPSAPNTGDFYGLVTSGAFSIILPLVVAIAIVTAASIAVVRKKHAK